MKRISQFLSVFSVLIAFPYDARCEIPDTYVGHWELNLERTFSIHFERMSKQHPEIFKGSNIEAIISGLGTATEAPGAKVLLTLTEDQISTHHASSGLDTTYPYRVISGSSDHVVIEAMPLDEDPIISTIRFVKGGIAVSQEFCSDDPQRCVRRQKKAQERAEKKAQERLTSAVPAAGEGTRDAPSHSLIIQIDRDSQGYSDQSPSTQAFSKQPEWFYFTKR